MRPGSSRLRSRPGDIDSGADAMMAATVPPPIPASTSTPPRSPKSTFYLPSPSTTTTTNNPLSRVASRHLALSVPTSPHSRHGHGHGHGHGQGHRRSKSSLAALRGALQTYQIPLESSGSGLGSDGVSELDLEGYSLGHERDVRDRVGESEGLMSPFERHIEHEMMDALVDIHRVLYRGREDREQEGQGDSSWEEQGKEVQRVVERWFEGDCLYDHPLVALTSRESILSHFILLHLISSIHLPTLTPNGLVEHARSITASLKDRILGNNDFGPSELAYEKPKSVKGKERAWSEELGIGLDVSPHEERVGRQGRWWKAWEVSADCREIGGMECYDGYNLALIEHTITLTLFPSLSTRSNNISSVPSSPASYASDALPPHTARIPPPPFLTRLAQSMAEEFDYFLHWDLPISTFVEFNEVGKATRIRDVVDVKDAIETFVPFAKRFGWLTRRVTGLISSTVGMAIMGLVGRPKVLMTEGIRIQSDVREDHDRPLLDEKKKQEYGLGLGSPEVKRNSLGLQGVQPGEMIEEPGIESEVSSMAPDCDDQPIEP